MNDIKQIKEFLHNRSSNKKINEDVSNDTIRLSASLDSFERVLATDIFYELEK